MGPSDYIAWIVIGAALFVLIFRKWSFPAISRVYEAFKDYVWPMPMEEDPEANDSQSKAFDEDKEVQYRKSRSPFGRL